jgi:NodT family efflux transporter outer membrane factor (OMF) lipoprotein
MSFNRLIVATITALLLLTGCMVGPDYKQPIAPTVDSYTRHPLNQKTTFISSHGKSNQSQQFVASDVAGEWWELFHSEELNNLVRVGLMNSPSVASAQAALKQAQEALYAQIGTSIFPTISAQASGQRQRSSGLVSPAVGGGNAALFDLYNPTLNISYTFDLFGGARRQLESLHAQIDYSQFQVEAANLTLTSNIVITAINSASLRAQIQATREIIRYQTDAVKIARGQFKLGGLSGADVLQQETELAQNIASLSPLQQSLAQSMNSLAALIGSLPSESDLPNFDLHQFHLPTKLPLSLPSRLVRQRPDIRASEALLHSASAQIGVATANFYPQLTLTGSYGWIKTIPGGLFSIQNVVWSYIGKALQPIFNGGALIAQKRSAVAAFEQATDQYKLTVVKAFQNVADTLSAIHNDANQLKAYRAAERAARQSLIITQSQLRLGGVNYLSLLTSQQQYQKAKIGRIQSEAARYIDTATLFQALGGGWWNRECKKCEV